MDHFCPISAAWNDRTSVTDARESDALDFEVTFSTIIYRIIIGLDVLKLRLRGYVPLFIREITFFYLEFIKLNMLYAAGVNKLVIQVCINMPGKRFS